MPVDVTSCWSTNSPPLPPVPVLKPYFPASLEGVCPYDWILANEMLVMSFGPIPVLTHENLLHTIIHTPSLLSGQNEKAPQGNAETPGL